MLTKRQKQLLDYITQFIQHNGYAPCLREIAHNFGLSSASTVWEHIRNLTSKGYIYVEKGIPRSISLPSGNLRIYGIISEGKPIEAIPIKESISFSLDWLSDRSNTFVLQVKGKFMAKDGINDGDYIIVERRTAPQNSDIVVALLGDKCVTLKKYRRQSGNIVLQPINGKKEPICVKDPVIWGVVRAVLRKF